MLWDRGSHIAFSCVFVSSSVLSAFLNHGCFRTVPISYFVDIVSLNALGLCMPLMFREEDFPLYKCINDSF